MARIKETNIYQRMLSATKQIKTVAKNLEVAVSKENSYKAVGEVDVLKAVKPIEEKLGIYSYPYSREVIESKQVETKSRYGDRTNFYIRLKTVYRFLNVDDPEQYIDIVSYGDGIDTGDKATGKAMTYCDKYALLKAYKIATGEDLDTLASEEYKKAEEKPVNVRAQLLAEHSKAVNKLDEYKIDFRGKMLSMVLEKANVKSINVVELNNEELNELIKFYLFLIHSYEHQQEKNINQNEAVHQGGVN